MSEFINYISIRNFKSIEAFETTKCKRINLLIGRPNVGKSNFLEALSLFSVPYLKENSAQKLSDLIRVENEAELFFNGNTEEPVIVVTDITYCDLRYYQKDSLDISIGVNSEAYSTKVDDKLFIRKASQTSRDFDTRIKKYVYRQNIVYKKGHSKYLLLPYGSNLLSIIERYPELKEEVINLFKEYNLEIAFDRASQTIKVIQKNKDGIFLIPYNSIADTLQRIIFYKAAIASNDNSILLFEEPEAHAFPPYMTQLTQDMIHKRDNQYFVATHSPFILNDLLENAPDELAVFVVYWENGSTQVRALSQEEMHEAYQSGVDFFTNSESFIG